MYRCRCRCWCSKRPNRSSAAAPTGAERGCADCHPQQTGDSAVRSTGVLTPLRGRRRLWPARRRVAQRQAAASEQHLHVRAARRRGAVAVYPVRRVSSRADVRRGEAAVHAREPAGQLQGGQLLPEQTVLRPARAVLAALLLLPAVLLQPAHGRVVFVTLRVTSGAVLLREWVRAVDLGRSQQGEFRRAAHVDGPDAGADDIFGCARVSVPGNAVVYPDVVLDHARSLRSAGAGV